MITVEIKNLDKFQRMIMRYPEVAVRNFNEAIGKSLVTVQRAASQRGRMPWDTGALGANWGKERALLKGVLYPKMEYAIFMHEGTKPHFPPIAAITPWARRHGIPPFLVALSISRKGTKAHPFLKEAVDEKTGEINKFFEDALDKTLKQL